MSTGGDEDPTNLRPMRGLSKAPIADKEDWANLFTLLKDKGSWSLPSDDQKEDQKKKGVVQSDSDAATTAGTGILGSRDMGVPANLTHGSQALTREILHRRVLAELTSTTSGGNSSTLAQRAVVDPKAVYEISLDGLRLSNLGVNPKGSASNSGVQPTATQTKELQIIAKTSALAEFKDVRRLSVNNNKLQSALAVEVVLPLLQELRELQLDFNLLDRLPQVSTLAKLEQLSVGHNAMVTLGESLVGQRLTSIDLTSNRLVSMPPSMRLPALTTLHLQHNKFTSLETLATLTHLTSLDVSSNALTTLSGIDNLVNLNELIASDNQLRQSALQAHKNPLRSLAPKLETLDLSNNRISSLNFFPACGFPKLWSLNVAHNAFHGEKTQRHGTPPPPALGKDGKMMAEHSPGEKSKKKLIVSKKKRDKNKKKRNNLGFDSDSSSGSSDLTDGLGDLDDDFGESLYDGEYEDTEKGLKSEEVEVDSPSNKSNNSKTTTNMTKPASGKGASMSGSKSVVANNSKRLGPSSSSSKSVVKHGGSGGGDRPPSTSSTVVSKALTATSTTPPAEPEVTFLTRVSTLFPALESLDLSQNSSDLVAEYSELMSLAKVTSLSEISLVGTLDMGPQRVKQHRDAIQAFLPDVRVVDGHEINSSGMKSGGGGVTVIDMTTGSGSSRPGSAAVARPMSSTGLRPTSALLKTATSRKNELSDFRDQLVTFLKDAESTKEKCENVIDFLDASVAWAFDGAEEPNEIAIKKYGRAGKPSADLVAEGEKKELDDLENQLKCDETMAAIRVRQEDQQRQQQIKSATLVAKKPATGDPSSSPGAKARLRASSSHSSLVSAGTVSGRTGSLTGLAATGGGRSSSLRRSASDSYSVTGSGVGGEKTRALEKMEKERKMMRPSFATEQKKFREEAKKESEDRLRQILEMTGNSKSSEAVLAKHKRQVAEMGTSTVGSPQKQPQRRPSASTSTQHTSDTADILEKTESFLARAMSSGGNRVSAGVGTSPEKTSAPVPKLALKTTVAGGIPEVRGGGDDELEDYGHQEGGPPNVEADVEFLLQQEDLDPEIKEMLLEEKARRAILLSGGDEDDDYYGGGTGGGSDYDDDDESLIHVTGDPRFLVATHVPTTAGAGEGSGALDTTTTEAEATSAGGGVPTVVPLGTRASVSAEVLRPNSASIRQRTQMGKETTATRRLGAAPVTHLETGQRSNDSTAVAHQSLILSRYTGSGARPGSSSSTSGSGSYDVSGVVSGAGRKPSGGFSLQKEVRKGASGLNSANMSSGPSTTTSGGVPQKAILGTGAVGGAGATILKPKHTVMTTRQGTTTKATPSVLKERSTSQGQQDPPEPSSQQLPPRKTANATTTTAGPASVIRTQPTSVSSGLTQGGGGGVSLNRRHR